MRRDSGYTLVELMVVITIITVLTLVAGVYYHDMQLNAQDANRLKDLTAIKQALEMYRNSNGSYPSNISQFVPKYLNAIPTDPGPSSYGYVLILQPTNYALCAHEEGSANFGQPPYLCTLSDCGGGLGSCNMGLSSE